MFSVPPQTTTSASPARMERRLDHGLHAGAADHAHGVSGDGIGDAGLDGGWRATFWPWAAVRMQPNMTHPPARASRRHGSEPL